MLRPGLRLQILALLGLLLVAAFVPLFLAISTYTRVILEQQRQRHARQLGQALARHVLAESRGRDPGELLRLLRQQREASDAVVVALYTTDGQPLASVGDARAAAALARPPRAGERTRVVPSHRGPALASFEAGPTALVTVAVRMDRDLAAADRLIRFVALYGGVVAGALLLLAYFALTALIVRPLGGLVTAAGRVAGGARRFEAPGSTARELAELARSLESMTASLREEEAALRQQVEEVAAKTRQLEAAQASLLRSERLASVGRLSAGLAHEIGNPLSALMAMQELLIDTDPEPQRRADLLRRMRDETQRIDRILRDLLQFARPARPEEVGEPGDVAEAVASTVALLGPHKQFREISLHRSLAPELPRVPLSPGQLTQLLLNLLLNAAAALDGSGEITLTAAPEADGVSISVEDTGPGIDASVADTLFEPFVTTKDVGAGSGLGLSVCRGLVDGAGGTLSAANRTEGGACFRVWLPVAGG